MTHIVAGANRLQNKRTNKQWTGAAAIHVPPVLKAVDRSRGAGSAPKCNAQDREEAGGGRQEHDLVEQW